MKVTTYLAVAALVAAGTAQAAPVVRRQFVFQRPGSDNRVLRQYEDTKGVSAAPKPALIFGRDSDDSIELALSRRENTPASFFGWNPQSPPTTPTPGGKATPLPSNLSLGGGGFEGFMNRVIPPQQKQQFNAYTSGVQGTVQGKVDNAKSFFSNPFSWVKHKVTNSTPWQFMKDPMGTARNQYNQKVDQVQQRVNGIQQNVNHKVNNVAHPLQAFDNKMQGYQNYANQVMGKPVNPQSSS